MSDNTGALVSTAARELVQRSPVLVEVGRLFEHAGHRIHLVGGSVRDALLGRLDEDLDLTTDARPEQVMELVAPWADAVWDIGIAFGTVGARKDGQQLEITTYRSESYDRTSRKPEVTYGESLDEDLVRRDFAMNAMALKLPDWTAPDAFVDLYGGMADLANGVIRTPGKPEDSFDDDPLRMLRAARFAAQLGFEVAPEVVAAMTDRAARIEIVSAERVRAELEKLLLAPHPRKGLTLLVDTGLASYVLPELPALRLEIDEHQQHKDVYEHSLQVLERAIALEHRLPGGGPDLVLRLAALLHDIGKPPTRRFENGKVTFHHHELAGARMAKKRLKALTFGKDVTDAVVLLTELHLRFHGYGQPDSSPWTDAAVRRYVVDAGDQLLRLHLLTRSDCTTRNQRRAQRLATAYDDLERRIAELAAQEELDAIRPDLDGNEIMAILGLPPGRAVGQAYKHLLALRMEHGPLTHEDAVSALRAWAEEHLRDTPAG